MADTKISALPAASTPLTGSEVVPINQSGVTSNVTVTNLTAGRNIYANNFIPSITTTTASATPINLTVNSTQYQTVNGTTTSQQFNLPDATTLSIGDTYYFNNNITISSVQINAHDGATSILALQAGGAAHVVLLTNSTTNGTWDVHSFIPSSASWGTATLSFNNSTSISGTVSWNGNTIGVPYGGTGLTSLTSNYIPYGNGTSAFSSSSTFLSNGSQLAVGTSSFAGIANFKGNNGSALINVLNNSNSNIMQFENNSGAHIFYMSGAIPHYVYVNGGLRLVVDTSGNTYPGADNAQTLGSASYRWSTVYAATALINTSDANQKTVIGSLDNAEQTVAKSIKSLFKTFRFNEAIAKKGDKARIHIGVIAQDVQQAFISAGLDPTKYALFCSDTFYKDADGKNYESQTDTEGKPILNLTPVTQLGIRYEELLCFVLSAM